jgi:hypothetical protein
MSSIGVRLVVVPVGSVRVRAIGVETGSVRGALGAEATSATGLSFVAGAAGAEAEAMGGGAFAGVGRFADTTATAITPITPASSPSFASLGTVHLTVGSLHFHYSPNSARLWLTSLPFAENSRLSGQPRRRTPPCGNRRSS